MAVRISFLPVDLLAWMDLLQHDVQKSCRLSEMTVAYGVGPRSNVEVAEERYQISPGERGFQGTLVRW